MLCNIRRRGVEPGGRGYLREGHPGPRHRETVPLPARWRGPAVRGRSARQVRLAAVDLLAVDHDDPGIGLAAAPDERDLRRPPPRHGERSATLRARATHLFHRCHARTAPSAGRFRSSAPRPPPLWVIVRRRKRKRRPRLRRVAAGRVRPGPAAGRAYRPAPLGSGCRAVPSRLASHPARRCGPARPASARCRVRSLPRVVRRGRAGRARCA